LLPRKTSVPRWSKPMDVGSHGSSEHPRALVSFTLASEVPQAGKSYILLLFGHKNIQCQHWLLHLSPLSSERLSFVFEDATTLGGRPTPSYPKQGSGTLSGLIRFRRIAFHTSAAFCSSEKAPVYCPGLGSPSPAIVSFDVGFHYSNSSCSLD